MKDTLTPAYQNVLKRAATFEGAWEDHPWGETVYKVGKKVFVFSFNGEYKGKRFLTLSFKLPESSDAALALPFIAPTGYGLGKAGWVTATFNPGDDVPVPLLLAWLEESYAAIAPKKKSPTASR